MSLLVVYMLSGLDLLGHNIGPLLRISSRHVERLYSQRLQNMRWVTSKLCNGRTVSRTSTKKSPAERAHR